MGFLDASAQLIAKKAENTEMSDVCEPLGQCETGARQRGAKAQHQLESDLRKSANRSRPSSGDPLPKSSTAQLGSLTGVENARPRNLRLRSLAEEWLGEVQR